jgi:nucleotide-binding universal stress UspA family protein/uncharacterized membrane protein
MTDQHTSNTLVTEGSAGYSVIAVSFEDDSNAYNALTLLKELDSQQRVGVQEAAVVVRTDDGQVVEKDRIGSEFLAGTASGGLIGLLLGIIGGPLGMLIGGTGGLMVGSLFDLEDVEETESVLGAISSSVQPGHTALLAVVAEHSPEVVDTAMTGLGGSVFRRPAADVEAEIAAAAEAERKAKHEARKELARSRQEHDKAAVKAKVDELKAKFHREPKNPEATASASRELDARPAWAAPAAHADHANRMTTGHPAHHDPAVMFKNVVVGILDVETGPDAIALARHLTARGRELTLLHVHVVGAKPAPDSGAALNERLRRNGVQQLAALRDRCGVESQVAWIEAGSPRRGLHDFAAHRKADLLVVRASHRDELGRQFIGDDARAILEQAPCAVAIAPVGYGGRDGTIKRIGVAYNDSAESGRALELARKLAAESNAELSAFEAVTAPLFGAGSGDAEGQMDQRVATARRQIASLGGIDANARFGQPVDELAHYSQSVDLLVLGSHRYTPYDHFLQQSTAQQLADAPASPLLVLPSPASS